MAFLVRPGLKNLVQLRRTFQIESIRSCNSRRYCSATKSFSDPLRILFCGSDQFSINALCALQGERMRSPDTIQTIDIICRPPKRVGAKLKKIREGSTLHPERFDHGVILDQDAFEIPNPDECELQTLTDLVSIKGAEMLVAAIRNRIFVPPLKPVASWSDRPDGSLRHAPKIHKEDMHVNWAQWTSAIIERRKRVLGPLWSFASAPSREQNGSLKKTRVIFESLRPSGIKDEDRILNALKQLGKTEKDLSPGLPFSLVTGGSDGIFDGNQPIFVKTCNDGFLRIDTIKVEGTKTAPALRASMKARLFADNPSASENTSGILYYRDTLS
ncbi:Methionyl-tRNA formyltransferase [Ascosphaera aggregata]|nr:Methionyl-tRNA formyltransferase [Ascosphaera aggregata]